MLSLKTYYYVILLVTRNPLHYGKLYMGSDIGLDPLHYGKLYMGSDIGLDPNPNELFCMKDGVRYRFTR